jgi:O-antigen ligase
LSVEFRQSPRALTRVELLLVGLTLLAPTLGGATSLWAQAIVVLAGAAVILAYPPTASVPGPLAVALVALLALGAVGFLPASWMAMPSWRQALTKDYELSLPATLSAQPWATAENLCLLFAGVVWASYLCTRQWQMRRGTLLAIYCGGLLALVVVDLVFEFTGVRSALWQPRLGTFGFFPNRNQTGNLIALGSFTMLALAFQAFDKRAKLGLPWAAGYVICLFALVITGSRAGVAIFFLGSLWLVLWITWRSRRKRKFGLGLAAVLSLLAGFLVFGGSTLERFIGRPDRPAELSADYRLRIQPDALKLLKEASWHGIGLGNFEPVFAQHRVASMDDNRAIHPESDWLWLGIELGGLAPGLLLGESAAWLASVFGWEGLPTSASLERVRAGLARSQDARTYDYTIHLANRGLRFAPLD